MGDGGAPLPSEPRVCGQLACQHDSHLRTLEGVRVVSCRRSEHDSTSTPTAAHDSFEVVLTDTILFPEGGGQPSDTGVMVTTKERSFRVSSVQNQDGVAVHRMVVPSSEAMDMPVEVGDMVDVHVDWERREDNMRQHTAQHLITACALEIFNRRTIGWHLGPSLSYLELEPTMSDVNGASDDARTKKTKKQTKMTQAELAVLENRVMTYMKEDLAVWPQWIENDSEEMVDIRQKMKARGAPPIPAGVEGPLRLVTIDSLDVCTCCGTHVKRLSELMAVKILYAESTPRSSRVWFVAGDRVLTVLGSAWAQQRALTTLISVPPEEHMRRCEALLSTQRSNAKSIKHWQAHAAKLEVENMLLRWQMSGALVPTRASALHSDEGDKNFVSAAASAFIDANGGDTLGSDCILLITAGKAEGFFAMVAGSADRIQELAPEVSRVLEGRGGFSRSVYTGKATNLRMRAEALAILCDN